MNCHTLKAANAIENGRAAGNGQMAAQLYTGQDAEDVANFVAKAVGQTQQQSGGGGEQSGG